MNGVTTQTQRYFLLNGTFCSELPCLYSQVVESNHVYHTKLKPTFFVNMNIDFFLVEIRFKFYKVF